MGEKIEKWLLTPITKVSEKITFTTAALGFNMLWLLLIVGVLTFINMQYAWQWQAVFYGCILAPLWEELAFRVLPVKIATIINPKLIIPVLALSCLLFGWGHGDGTNSLLIQGMGGVFLSIVYLKTNHSYWAVVAMHAAWNTWVYFLA